MYSSKSGAFNLLFKPFTLIMTFTYDYKLVNTWLYLVLILNTQIYTYFIFYYYFFNEINVPHLFLQDELFYFIINRNICLIFLNTCPNIIGFLFLNVFYLLHVSNQHTLYDNELHIYITLVQQNTSCKLYSSLCETYCIQCTE